MHTPDTPSTKRRALTRRASINFDAAASSSHSSVTDTISSISPSAPSPPALRPHFLLAFSNECSFMLFIPSFTCFLQLLLSFYSSSNLPSFVSFLPLLPSISTPPYLLFSSIHLSCSLHICFCFLSPSSLSPLSFSTQRPISPRLTLLVQ